MNLLELNYVLKNLTKLQSNPALPSLPHMVRGPESYAFDLKWAVYILAFVLAIVSAWGVFYFLKKVSKKRRSIPLHQSSIEELRRLIPEEPFDKESQVNFLHKADLLFRSIYFSTTGFKAQATTLIEFKNYLESTSGKSTEDSTNILEVLALSEQIKFSKKTFSKRDAQTAKKTLLEYSEKLIDQLKANEEKKRKPK